MKFPSRSILVGLPLLLLVSAPLWLRPISSFLEPPAIIFDQTSQLRNAQQRFLLEGITFFQSEGNRQKVRLTARQAFSADPDGEITLTDVAAELTNPNGQVIDIESLEAIYGTPKQQVTLRHSVTLRTDDFTGETELLHFFPEVKQVQTTAEVSLARPGLKIKGSGLSFDLGTGKLVLGGFGRVSCFIE